ncbi:hypothetical protein [Pseudonocardia sp. ICBG1034]|uniref:hypothetical protein n=1 Tax=Pseudonocardia sp. ICBG1034 TaxID=2844381 RepID=UPI001CCF6BC2|nr:hypothetical protein [Pseudonocardia sp. ICBG1034]
MGGVVADGAFAGSFLLTQGGVQGRFAAVDDVEADVLGVGAVAGAAQDLERLGGVDFGVAEVQDQHPHDLVELLV